MEMAKTKASIKRRTIEDMKRLGVYKSEYDQVIDIYAGLVEQHDALCKQFKDSGHQVTVDTAQGNSKKAPVVAALESLRKDILAYSDRLCLNPKAAEQPGPPKKISKLAQILSELN